jgi:hypothetical protein
MPLILGTNSIKDTGYDVANSLRFNSGSSDSLNKSASAGNRKTFTISSWIKPSTTGYGVFFSGKSASTSYANIQFPNGNSKFQFAEYQGGDTINLETNRLFRDLSAWWNVVIAVDTTQSTASNRIKLYLNGVQETSFATETYPSQNADTVFNSSSSTHRIGCNNDADGGFFNGYMAETVLIDGQQLDPTSFGEFDQDSPTIWKPKDVSGLTFGTNGFYLDFEDSSALGNDAAGSNNFTVNNLTAIDQSTDTCTNNFATLNPLNAASGGTFTLDEGNLRVKGADTIEGYTSSTIGFSQGKWYFECESNFNTQGVVGITFDGDSGQVADDVRSDRYPGNATYSYGYIFSSGNKITNSSGSSYGNSLATGDILGVAIDLDNMKLYFSKNGTFQNSGVPTSGSTGTGAIDLTGSGSTGFCFVTVGDNNNAGYGQIDFNFGSPFFAISSGNSDANGYGNFEYSVPSGYYSLNTKNLAEFG